MEKIQPATEFTAPFSVEFLRLPDDYDGTWRRDETQAVKSERGRY